MRRRSLVGCALACALLFAAPAKSASAAAPAAGFAGTWVLDKTKSKDLPRWMDNFDSHTLTVAQDEKQLTVDSKFESKGGGPAAQSGGQSGGGQGGGTGSGRGRTGFGMGGPMSLTYKLDGSETTSELSGGGRPGTSTLKADWKDDGKALELTNTRKFTTPDGEERTATTRERWELSADGKTLTVNRASESPRGTMKSTLVFNKQ